MGIRILYRVDWQRKGIMKAAVKELIRYGTDVLGYDIIVRCHEVNIASTSMIEGMTGWERVPERDIMMPWMEVKGGGMRKLLVWKWKGPLI